MDSFLDELQKSLAISMRDDIDKAILDDVVGNKKVSVTFLDRRLLYPEQRVVISVRYNNKGDVLEEYCNRVESKFNYDYYLQNIDWLIDNGWIDNYETNGDCEWDRKKRCVLSTV